MLPLIIALTALFAVAVWMRIHEQTPLRFYTRGDCRALAGRIRQLLPGMRLLWLFFLLFPVLSLLFQEAVVKPLLFPGMAGQMTFAARPAYQFAGLTGAAVGELLADSLHQALFLLGFNQMDGMTGSFSILFLVAGVFVYLVKHPPAATGTLRRGYGLVRNLFLAALILYLEIAAGMAFLRNGPGILQDLWGVLSAVFAVTGSAVNFLLMLLLQIFFVRLLVYIAAGRPGGARGLLARIYSGIEKDFKYALLLFLPAYLQAFLNGLIMLFPQSGTVAELALTGSRYTPYLLLLSRLVLTLTVIFDTGLKGAAGRIFSALRNAPLQLAQVLGLFLILPALVRSAGLLLRHNLPQTLLLDSTAKLLFQFGWLFTGSLCALTAVVLMKDGGGGVPADNVVLQGRD